MDHIYMAYQIADCPRYPIILCRVYYLDIYGRYYVISSVTTF